MTHPQRHWGAAWPVWGPRLPAQAQGKFLGTKSPCSQGMEQTGLEQLQAMRDPGLGLIRESEAELVTALNLGVTLLIY